MTASVGGCPSGRVFKYSGGPLLCRGSDRGLGAEAYAVEGKRTNALAGARTRKPCTSRSCSDGPSTWCEEEGRVLLDWPRSDKLHARACVWAMLSSHFTERPRVYRRLYSLRGWRHDKSTSYSQEVRERAVRLVLKDHAGHDFRSGPRWFRWRRSLAAQRRRCARWVRRAEGEAGLRRG